MNARSLAPFNRTTYFARPSLIHISISRYMDSTVKTNQASQWAPAPEKSDDVLDVNFSSAFPLLYALHYRI